MSGEGEHRVAVDAWWEGVSPGRSVDALIGAFEAAFAGLWERSCLTLGEVTLIAIVERVLHTASEPFPILAAMEVGSAGLRCDSLRAHADSRHDEVARALRFVLVEFLTVLGNLTADILTPALHAELSPSAPRPRITRHEEAALRADRDRASGTSTRCSTAGCPGARSPCSAARRAPARPSSPSRSASTTPRAEQRALCFSTLSEPTAKTLRYLSQFSFFDRRQARRGRRRVRRPRRDPAREGARARRRS